MSVTQTAADQNYSERQNDENSAQYMEYNQTETLEMANRTIYQISRIITVQTEPHIFEWGSIVVTVPMIALLLYLATRSAFPKDVFKYLAMQHLLVGYVHVLCLTFYVSIDSDVEIFSSLLEEIASLIDLVSVLTTSCIAWIIFLRLFLFRDGEELYDIKGVTLFATLFLPIIQGYESLVNMLNSDDFLISTLRLTSILLIMCVSFSALCVTVICFLSNFMSLPKSRALFSIGHLLLFISSDIILLRFNFESQSELLWLWDVLLYSRLVLEIIWYCIYDCFLKEYVF